ncbi:hypothetical protein AVEN_222900-1 [Araneus ventricosus]|uniref:Uncharacterized protein n=1 Tax=Araneus ventricosus TaxID=182803 RepID=A0A4Y2BQK2_ARAVE|nr:hypothetical protein AVEN_222900-1 [Araneus ventricosus]
MAHQSKWNDGYPDRLDIQPSPPHRYNSHRFFALTTVLAWSDRKSKSSHSRALHSKRMAWWHSTSFYFFLTHPFRQVIQGFSRNASPSPTGHSDTLLHPALKPRTLACSDFSIARKPPHVSAHYPLYKAGLIQGVMICTGHTSAFMDRQSKWSGWIS